MIYFQDYVDRMDLLHNCFNLIYNKIERMEKRLDRIEDSIRPPLTADVKPTPNIKEDDMPCQQTPSGKAEICTYNGVSSRVE